MPIPANDPLANALADSDRFAGRRTVSDLLGELYDEWVDTAHSVIATQQDMMSQYGPDFVLWFNANSSIGSNWWGSPRWPQAAEDLFNAIPSYRAGLGLMRNVFRAFRG